ncbi:MAG TPA: DHA2 family efflux MFS transporter permease subunit [Polyangiaceae bacterium]|nr:DHA2 family efflux MFS transporter permease subunit [Polyangiaceae bacterium]
MAQSVPLVPAQPRAAAGGKWAIAIAVALGALLEVVDVSIVNVALTDMQNTLGATLSEVSWVVSGYAVANVIVLPLTAWLGDRFGKKTYFIFSLIGFTIASVMCGLSTSLPMLIIARVLQGLMGGGLLAKAQAILFETFPKEEQGVAQAFFGAIVIAGPAIGPTLGGYLVTNIGWRWIFFVNVPIGILAVAMCSAALAPDTATKNTSRIDWVAILMLATGLGTLQTLLEEGNSEDWFDSKFITTLFVTSIVSLGAFVYRELKSPIPVVDLRVLRYRSLWAGSILSVIVGMALYGALFAVPIFAQSLMGYTSQETGMLLLPSALASAATMILAGQVIRKVDSRLGLVTGALILVFAVHQLSTLTASTGADDFFWPLIIRSVGTVCMFLPLNMATLGPIPKKDISAASGFFNLTRQLGGSIGVALLTLLLTTRQAFHRAVLVEKMSSGDPAVVDRIHALTGAFVAKGAALFDAQKQALAALNGIVNREAAVMSFNDTFWATGVLILVFLPLVLLLGKVDKDVKVEAGH